MWMHFCILSAIYSWLTYFITVFGDAAVNVSKFEGVPFRLNCSDVSTVPYYGNFPKLSDTKAYKQTL